MKRGWVVVPRALLDELADDTPCRFDHDGNCQEHDWFGGAPGDDLGVCPDSLARSILDATETNRAGVTG